MRRPLLLGFGETQQIAFARRLSTYLGAGIPILEALSMLRKDTHGGEYVLDLLIANVTEGRTLSQGLREFPRQFKGFCISLIEMGEQSGTLPHSLSHVAQTLGQQRALTRKLASALAYPLIIVLATAGICSFLILYAFPRIVPLFRGFDSELPFATRTLIALSDSMAQYGLWMLIGAVVMSVAGILLLRRPYIRTAFDKALLRAPGIGGVLRSYYLTRTSRSMHVLLAAGVGIVRALDLAAASGNRAYAAAFTSCRTNVLEGEKLADALSRYRYCFPRMYTQMIATGERTGSLPAMFLMLETQYEEDFVSLSERLTALIEPVLMIVMGLLVGFIALAIITPVYQITQDFHG